MKKHAGFLVILILLLSLTTTSAAAQTEPPADPIKLIFIHHSCGENWLTDGYGNLGPTLADNNYFVSDTNYGWGRRNIGDRTDIVDWPAWFGAERDERVLADLYNETNQLSSYTRAIADPGGENQIILFKSCFPNSDLYGNPTDPPQASYDMTVGSAKHIYLKMLNYFSTQPDKMFIAITAPPLLDPTNAQNARAFNQWLVTEWLDGYSGSNVHVFDFHAILTHPDNHHRLVDGSVEYVNTNGNGTLHYDSGGDEHPNEIGSQKATDEFVPLLNYYVQSWRGAQPAPQVESPGDPPPATNALQPETNAEQPQSAAPQVIASEDMIDDFDTISRHYECYADDSGSSYEMAPTNERAYGGENSLRMVYNLDADGWLDCGSHFEQALDWSVADGISLAVSSQQPGQKLTLTVFATGEAGPIPYEVVFSTTDAMVDDWEIVSFSWGDFNLAPWADSGPEQLNPASMTGYAIGNPFGSAENTLYVDSIRLGQAQAAAPQPAHPVDSSEAQPVPQEQAAEEESGIGRMLPSICPGAFILPVLACALFLWMRRFS